MKVLTREVNEFFEHQAFSEDPAAILSGGGRPFQSADPRRASHTGSAYESLEGGDLLKYRL